jgi:AcrR family transcriptional regulator
VARPAEPLASERRQRLHLAAAEEFATLGFERASLNRIVEASGLAKSSFYHHVGSKQALFDDLLVFLAELGGQIPRPDPASLTAANFWDAARDVLASFEQVESAHPALRDLAALVYTPHGAGALQRVRIALVDAARVYLARGQELGVVRTDLSADLLAEIAISVLTSFDAWTLAHDPVPPTVVEALVPTLRRLLEER